MIKFFLILFFSSTALAVGNVPDDIKTTTESEVRLRYLHPVKQFTLFSEIQLADQSDGREYKTIFLGSYYRFFDNLRAGLFYQRQYGFRHNEDWFKDSSAVWQWKNTEDRGEDLAILDVSPKFSLGNNWTFEFKTRYEYNFFNSDQSLRLRPNLTYFWLGEDKPIASFFLQAEHVLALNYGSHSTEERWAYLGALYHHSSNLQYGAFAAQKWQAWTSTPAYTATTGKTYSVDANSNVLGVMLILKK